MPLTKNGRISKGILGADGSKFDDLLRHDFVRRMKGGSDVSFRSDPVTGHRSALAVVEALKVLAEPGVEINDQVITQNASAYKLLAREMGKVFAKVSSVGICPKVPNLRFSMVMARTKMSADVVNIGHYASWYPVSAKVMANEIVVMFRVWKHSESEGFDSPTEVHEIDNSNSGLVAIAMKDLPSYSPEIAGYVNKLVGYANENESVKEAFATLLKMLRPAEARQAALEEANKRYEGVKSFGEWG